MLRLLHSRCERAKLSYKKMSANNHIKSQETSIAATYHITLQILLLLALEPPQLLHDTRASIRDVLLANLQRLAKMAERLLRLAEGISPRALRVRVRDALDGVRQAAEQLVRDAAGSTLVRAVGWRW